jgi:hypothetical protein
MKALRDGHKSINQRVTTSASPRRMSALHKNESNNRFIAIGGGKAMQIFHYVPAMSGGGDALVTSGYVQRAAHACIATPSGHAKVPAHVRSPLPDVR